MSVTVLFIDDDNSLTRLYKKKVGELGVSIHSEDTVDGALRYLRDERRLAADIIVWDMSMPAGMEFADKDTDGGLFTGRFLYPVLTDLRPQSKFILLTNRTETIDEYFVPREGSYAYEKLTTTPAEFAQIVRGLLPPSSRV